MVGMNYSATPKGSIYHWIEPVTEWRLQGKGYLVAVKHHSVTSPTGDDGPNRWAVYAYLYPTHWHFPAFDLPGHMWQEATLIMPLHGDCSYLRAHRDDDNSILSIQVGADYNHVGDDRFSYIDGRNEAWTVFDDAERLFEWLKPREQAA